MKTLSVTAAVLSATSRCPPNGICPVSRGSCSRSVLVPSIDRLRAPIRQRLWVCSPLRASVDEGAGGEGGPGQDEGLAQGYRVSIVGRPDTPDATQDLSSPESGSSSSFGSGTDSGTGSGSGTGSESGPGGVAPSRLHSRVRVYTQANTPRLAPPYAQTFA